jgi:hypothetical protein
MGILNGIELTEERKYRIRDTLSLGTRANDRRAVLIEH